MFENHEIGEIIKGKEIGRGGTSSRFMWVRCPDCHEERWAAHTSSNNTTLRTCKDCSISRAKKTFFVGRGFEHKLTYKKKME